MANEMEKANKRLNTEIHNDKKEIAKLKEVSAVEATFKLIVSFFFILRCRN